MKIERIERSKHKQERVLVYLEGGDLLRVTESELLHFGLYIGLDIDGETVVQLQKCGARSETRVRAANMISARPLSRRELTRRLVQKGAEADDADAAADYLEQLGAVDDATYAALLVRHYSAQGYGPARIRDEFCRRGVPRECWDAALEAAPDAGETLARLIAAKTKGQALSPKEHKRLTDLLLRRGFSWSEVRSALREAGIRLENEESL